MDLMSLSKIRNVLIIIFLLFSRYGYSQEIKQKINADLLPVGFETVHLIDGLKVIITPIEKGIWQLGSYDPNGNALWKRTYQLESNEYLIDARIINNEIRFLRNQIFLDEGRSMLRYQTMNMFTGNSSQISDIWDRQILAPITSPEKAKLIADANLELASIRNSSVEVPFYYRFQTELSPDGKLSLVSHFDFSQEKLIHEYIIISEQGEVIRRGSLKIDDLVYLYDVEIDNSGNLYHANLSFEGDMQILKFPIKDESFSLLKVTSGNSIRDDLKIHILDTNRVALVAKAEAEDSFYGALYAIADFNENDVDRIHFEARPYEVNEAADSLMRLGELEVKDWSNYKLSELRSFNDEELLIVFEDFNLRRSGYVFKDQRFATDLDWNTNKARVISGPAIIFSFDKTDELRWTRFINKKKIFDTDLKLSKTFFTTSPKNEEIEFFSGNETENFSIRMDYIYNSWEKKNQLTEGLLMDVKESDEEKYLILLSSDGQQLILKNYDN